MGKCWKIAKEKLLQLQCLLAVLQRRNSVKVEQCQRLPVSAVERLACKNLKRSKGSTALLGAVALTTTEPYQSCLKDQLPELGVDQP